MPVELLWIALAAGGAAVTVTKSRFFEEFRQLVALFVEWTDYRWPLVKLAQLVRCPYCASYWLVGLAWLLWTPKVAHPVLLFFATVTVATTVAAIMARAYSWGSE